MVLLSKEHLAAITTIRPNNAPISFIFFKGFHLGKKVIFRAPRQIELTLADNTVLYTR